MRLTRAIAAAQALSALVLWPKDHGIAIVFAIVAILLWRASPGPPRRAKSRAKRR